MNIRVSLLPLLWLVHLSSILLCSCQKKSGENDVRGVSPPTINIPTEARVVATAKDFIRIYLKDQDADEFLVQTHDMMNGDYVPIFNIHQNRWYVSFISGLNCLSVTMTKDLDMGTVRGTHSKVISSEIHATDLEGDYSDLPLFTLSEFARVVDLPRNKDRGF
jgi:hypothetical protein